jgi:hypothetical protein
MDAAWMKTKLDVGGEESRQLTVESRKEEKKKQIEVRLTPGQAGAQRAAPLHDLGRLTSCSSF